MVSTGSATGISRLRVATALGVVAAMAEPVLVPVNCRIDWNSTKIRPKHSQILDVFQLGHIKDTSDREVGAVTAPLDRGGGGESPVGAVGMTQTVDSV